MSQLELNIPEPKPDQELEIITREELEKLSDQTLREIYKNDFIVSADEKRSRDQIIEAIMDPEKENARLFEISRNENNEAKQKPGFWMD